MPQKPAAFVASIPGLIALNAYWIPLALQEAALLAIAVPAELLRLVPHDYVHADAVLVSLVALVNTIVPPLAGILSDRLRRRHGERRTLVFLGAILNIAGLLLMMSAPSLGVFTLYLMVASLGQTISSTAYQAMLPDTVAPSAWGIASGVRGAATLIGTVGGLGIAAALDPAVVFAASAVLVAVGALSLLMFHENPHSVADDHAHIADWHDFIVVFIARGVITFGLVLLMTFILYFFKDGLHVLQPSLGTGLVGVGALVGAAVTSIWLGRASDRVERKVVVALCGIPMSLAAFGFALYPEQQYMFAFAVLFGLGYGGVISTGWALALDTIPQLGDVARDLGIWGLATHVPAVIAPLVANAIISNYRVPIDGYKVLFGSAALTFVIGSFSVLAVRGTKHART